MSDLILTATAEPSCVGGRSVGMTKIKTKLEISNTAQCSRGTRQSQESALLLLIQTNEEVG